MLRPAASSKDKFELRPSKLRRRIRNSMVEHLPLVRRQALEEHVQFFLGRESEAVELIP